MSFSAFLLEVKRRRKKSFPSASMRGPLKDKAMRLSMPHLFPSRIEIPTNEQDDYPTPAHTATAVERPRHAQ